MENTIEKKAGSNVRMMKVAMTKDGRSLGHVMQDRVGELSYMINEMRADYG